MVLARKLVDSAAFPCMNRMPLILLQRLAATEMHEIKVQIDTAEAKERYTVNDENWIMLNLFDMFYMLRLIAHFVTISLRDSLTAAEYSVFVQNWYLTVLT